MGLTAKQEKFCQELVKRGNKTDAYKAAYSTKNMKAATINNKAYALSLQGDVAARIEQLRRQVAERNKITVDECVSLLADIARFDIAELYDKDGQLKPVHKIKKEARTAIESLESDEIRIEGQKIGDIRKVKTSNRRAAIDLLMKYLGGYEKDHAQAEKYARIPIEIKIVKPTDEMIDDEL